MAKKVKAARPVPQLQVQPENWPAWAVERRRIDQLKPHPRNPNSHPQEQTELLTESAARFGAVKPIVVDENDVILAGHGFTGGLKRLGAAAPEVPVVVVRGWSEDQKLEFILADNQLARLAKLDKQLAGLALADLSKLATVDIKALGFKQAELDRLIPKVELPGAGDPNAAPPPASQVVTRPGDLWLLGGHRLFCGDSTRAADVAAVLQGDKPHLMVTDPPYGVDYDPDWRNHAGDLGYSQEKMGGSGSGGRAVGTVDNDHRADWREAWALFPGDVAYVWHASLFTDVVIASLEACGLKRRYQLIWNKNKHSISRGDYHWKHEPCWYVVREGANSQWAGDRSQKTVWDIETLGGFLSERPDMVTGHGTQKPVECMKRPMHNNSREGDFVYEPFCGSGTTLIAAEQLQRRCLAIELRPDYVDIAVKRWESFTKKSAILAAGQLTVAQVAEARGIALAA